MSVAAPLSTPDLARVRAHAEDFRPRRFLSNAHLQTIAGNFLPRPHHLDEPEAVRVEVSPETNHSMRSEVLCHCHWQAAERRATAPTAVIVHGLEGSSSSQYVLGTASKLWNSGCNAIRMNMRNCGGTERLSPTLYHSALSGDVLAVLRFFIQRDQLTSMAVVGYSMGGNLVLKLAGELGSTPPPELRCAVGISPAVDLALSADALHEPQNRLYERRFLRALLRRFRRKAALFPGAYDLGRAFDVRSLRVFDDRITALYSGFRSADDYYHRAAAARVLNRIAVPTLMLHAEDDPFVRLSRETRAVIAGNPHIRFVEPRHGGHCAFLATPDRASGYDGYWAEHTLLRFILGHT